MWSAVIEIVKQLQSKIQPIDFYLIIKINLLLT